MESAEQLKQLADDWMAEIRSGDLQDDQEESFGSKVTDLSFFSTHETQWTFLKIATNKAENDEELGYVAAFLFEQLMSTHGDHYIDEVERLAANDEKFKSMVERSWRHGMKRTIWSRIRKIQGVEPKGLLQRLAHFF